MTKDFEAYLRLDKTGLENKYVIFLKSPQLLDEGLSLSYFSPL